MHHHVFGKHHCGFSQGYRVYGWWVMVVFIGIWKEVVGDAQDY